MTENGRLRALDSLRGLAAIGVLVWHYQHFTELRNFSAPFESQLRFFYKSGWIMVDFFFCLSGFVMYKRYLSEINCNQISLKKFLIIRLARLYPLVVITLIVTALLNWTLFLRHGKFFIYKVNDFGAFLLNLVFMQSGFFPIGYSFNAPTWSIGIEFWMYIIFFVFVASFKRYSHMNFVLANMFIVLFFLSIQYNQIKFGIVFLTPEFVRGFSSFFLGGLIYLLYEQAKNLEIRTQEILGSMVFSIALIVLFLRNLTFDPNSKNAAEYLKLGDLSLIIFAFPLLLVGGSISSHVQRVLVFRPLAFTGDISFSIYMWHVPIQLLIILLAESFNMNINPGDTIFFLFYLASVFLFAILSTFLVEKPLQAIIKKKFVF